jgi:hypothetical protein
VESDGGGNPMAEIALALAMAFFSIMVVTMVSMGAGEASGRTAAPLPADGIELRPSAAPAARPRPSDRGAPEPAYLIHYRGAYYDRALKPAEPAAVADGPLVLAIDPALPMAEAMAVRARVPGRQVTVTTLDERWLKTLQERFP